ELLEQHRYELHHTDLPLTDQSSQIDGIMLPVGTREYQ
ncbi:hypothetical protein PSYJA_45256, partial [Pseudomonas syringae pv. japonica str. M301072]